MTATNRRRGAHEFSDCSTKRNVSIKNIERSFRLVDAAASDAGEYMDGKQRNGKTCQCGHGEKPPSMRLRKWTEQCQVGPVNGKAEANHGETGEDSDEHGEH